MNGIGIIEWRDTAVASSYPLERSIISDSLFVDASFVQFDNFIPTLKSISVQADAISFIFTLDDGEYVIDVSAADCVEGKVLTLRKNARFYGRIVCGPGIASLYNTRKGSTLSVNTKFLPITVRAIPSGCGLYSLQGISQNVTVLPDQNQRLEVQGHNVTWNTVSKPSRAEQFNLEANKLYAVTTAKKLIELDPVSGAISVVMTLPKAYNAVVLFNQKLLASEGSSIVDLTMIPPTVVLDIGVQIKALAVGEMGGDLLALTTDNKIAVITTELDAVLNWIDLTVPAGSALVYTDDTYIYTSPGPFDPTVSKNISDFIYKYQNDTASLVGVLAVNQNFHQPPLYGLAELNGTIYGLISDNVSSKLLAFSPTTCTGTEVLSYQFDTSTGKLISLTTGIDLQLTRRNVTALKTLNGQMPVANTMQLLGSNLIQVEQTAADELTVRLAVDLDNTVIQRSTKYE